MRFVHITAVERAGMQTLRENQRVSYDLQEDRPGKMSATNLRSAEEGEQSPPPARRATLTEDSDNTPEGSPTAIHRS